MDAEIAAILLAAGESRRMGRPKLLLPWGDTTVLGRVIASFASGLSSAMSQENGPAQTKWEILVVTGGDREPLEKLVEELANKYPVRAIFNPEYARSGMLSSLQAGIRALNPTISAALVGLGDQPQVKPQTVRDIYAAYSHTDASLVVPSFQLHRGHPWLVTRPLWEEILALPTSVTPRKFLQEHATDTNYVPADDSILKDLDTPEEYNRLRP